MNLKNLILNESFFQSFPLRVDAFIRYCKDRGLIIDKRYLEYLEKEKVFFPIMRIEGEYVNNTTDLIELFERGCVYHPGGREFVPWDQFFEKREKYRREYIHTYYHPYQIHFLNELLKVKISVSPSGFSEDNDKLLVNVRKWEEYLRIHLDILRKKSQHYEKYTELLLLIQNKYLPHIKQSGSLLLKGDVYSSIDYNLSEKYQEFEKYQELSEEIIPETIIGELGLEIDRIKEYRLSVGGTGHFVDPLEKWYHLVKYIKHEKREKLKGNALLAQDFYLTSDMLAKLLEDLISEKQLDTGSIFDSMEGRGLARYYGKELNYIDRDILIRILREYGIYPRPRLVFIVEGYTEEIAFPIVSKALEIPLESYDIEIVNIRGISRDPRELIIYHATPDVYQVDKEYYIHPERTKIFIILDNEGINGWGKKFIVNPNKEITGMMGEVLGILKMKKADLSEKVENILLDHTIKFRIWEKNFEYDNFTNEELSRELNEYGKLYGYEFNITPDEIEVGREVNKNLDKLVREKTSTNLNKVKFGERLANLIANEIKKRSEPHKDQRKIEKVLSGVVRFAITEKYYD